MLPCSVFGKVLVYFCQQVYGEDRVSKQLLRLQGCYSQANGYFIARQMLLVTPE